MSVDATIATWKLTKKQVTTTEKLFLLSCADRAGEHGICWPSIKRLCADTCMDRKTIGKVRQSVINKGLLRYTGKMEGRTKLVPVMQLLYISQRSPEADNDPKNGTLNDPKNGIVSSLNDPKNGTLNDPKNGIVKQAQIWATEPISLNLKDEAGVTQPAVNFLNKEITPVELINIYHDIMPNNPRVLVNKATGEVEKKVLKVIKEFKNWWGKEYDSLLTGVGFKSYLNFMLENCPRFVLEEYPNEGGIKQKNSLIIFLKWETAAKLFADRLY